MGEIATSVDRISELPDFILHHILSYLRTKEAAQTCLISKRWQCIWETFPILKCNESLFGMHLDITNPRELGLPKDVRRRIFNQRVTFMKFVDKELQRLYEKDVRVKKFHLIMTLVSMDLWPHVDSWMDLVSGLGVQEIELFLTSGKGRFYTVPAKVLASQSLTILRLRGCLLSYCFYGDVVKLCSLSELYLQDTFVDQETIQNLVISIRSLEVLSLKKCFGFTELEIHGNDKLRKMVYHPHKDVKVEKFSIDVPKLEELEFCGVDKEETGCLIIINSGCRNLKRLSLCCVLTDSKWLQDTIASFPLLEHIFLGECVVREETLKLSSSVLKEVHLRNCKNIMEAEFYMPELYIFRYHGKNMPRLLANSAAGNRIAELPVLLKNMDSSWIMKLNSFLKDNRFQDLTLFITARRDSEISFNAEDFIGFQLPVLYELKTMKLVVHAFTSINYTAFLDGLLWSLRPQILSLELNCHSPEVVKGLLKSLLIEEERSCYCSQTFGCWRHSLKDVRFVNVKGFETGSSLDLFALSRLNSYLDDWANSAHKIVNSYGETGEMLSFSLQW